jgi:hypothetical protein
MFIQHFGQMVRLNRTKYWIFNVQIILSQVELCRTEKERPSRVEHPSSKEKFIVCLSETDKYTIFDCPTGLMYNKFWDRCDYDQETFSSGCESQPCQYGSKCIDLGSNEFRCECRAGYSGILCENAPDICDTEDRCGPLGQCNSLPWTSIIPYYCTCMNNKRFGMSCDAEKSEPNPCLSSTLNEDGRGVFSTKIDPFVFVHCHRDQMKLKFCSNFSDLSKCLWLDLKSNRIQSKFKLRSYFENLKK